MTKKIERLTDYVSAEDAANIVSARLGRQIPAGYMYKLAHRKKNPVRTQQMGNRFLYNRADIETCTVTQKQSNDTPHTS